MLRRVDGQPFLTDNGNYVVDCVFGAIAAPADLEREIKRLTGVVETGLFVGMTDMAVIGTADGITTRPRPGARS